MRLTKGPSGREQPRICHLARLYSRRQKAYEDFMSEVHRYIITLKGAERQMRKDDEKKADPFGTKVNERTNVVRRLSYVQEGEETKKLHVRKF